MDHLLEPAAARAEAEILEMCFVLLRRSRLVFARGGSSIIQRQALGGFACW